MYVRKPIEYYIPTVIIQFKIKIENCNNTKFCRKLGLHINGSSKNLASSVDRSDSDEDFSPPQSRRESKPQISYSSIELFQFLSDTAFSIFVWYFESHRNSIMMDKQFFWGGTNFVWYATNVYNRNLIRHFGRVFCF